MVLLRFKIHYWPVFTSGLLVFNIIITYLIAVYNKHVYYFFPYISDSGVLPPESCIFSELLNFEAITLAITLYIRYRQIDFDIKSETIKLSERWNKISLYLAMSICLGMTIVANFPETHLFFMHIFGASLTFGNAILYFYVQTRISFASSIANSSYKISKKLLYFRGFLAASFLPLYLLTAVYSFMALREFKGETMIWWTENDGGFEMRLISTFSEWLLALFLYAYVCTFTNEFKALNYEQIVFSSNYKKRRFSDQ